MQAEPAVPGRDPPSEGPGGRSDRRRVSQAEAWDLRKGRRREPGSVKAGALLHGWVGVSHGEHVHLRAEYDPEKLAGFSCP